MPQVKYIGPLDAVELIGYGEVKRGDVIDVPAELAGHAPEPRLEAAHLELREATAALDHERCKALREEIIGLDPGAGLLAQVGNWQAVTTKPSKAAASGEEAQP